jgi:hypothetical protein
MEGQVSEACRAPAEAVYALLADLSRHLEWGGRRRSKRSRLLSIDAPAAWAAVGTEFTSTGEDSMRQTSDRSVVTVAVQRRAFEFVTESSSRLKRSGKRVDWTIVHRYDITPAPVGCRITYAYRATRATSLSWPLWLFHVPVLRAIAWHVPMAEIRSGLRNLARMAEEGGS